VCNDFFGGGTAAADPVEGAAGREDVANPSITSFFCSVSECRTAGVKGNQIAAFSLLLATALVFACRMRLLGCRGPIQRFLMHVAKCACNIRLQLVDRRLGAGGRRPGVGLLGWCSEATRGPFGVRKWTARGKGSSDASINIYDFICISLHAYMHTACPCDELMCSCAHATCDETQSFLIPLPTSALYTIYHMYVHVCIYVCACATVSRRKPICELNTLPSNRTLEIFGFVE
jgi:hypothetical protein